VDVPEITERINDLLPVSQRPTDLKLLGNGEARRRIVTLESSEKTGGVQRFRSHLGHRLSIELQEPGDPLPPFGQVAPEMPEKAERSRKPKATLGVASVGQSRQRDPQIVVLELEPIEPRRKVRFFELWLDALGESEKVLCVPSESRRDLAPLAQTLFTVLAERFQETVARTRPLVP
jgi:hypothetical protein